MTRNLGDAPIEDQYKAMMNEIAASLDQMFNGHVEPKRTGFILMVFPFDDHEGRANYISNANRRDVIVLLKEQLARFSGMPDMRGNA